MGEEVKQITIDASRVARQFSQAAHRYDENAKLQLAVMKQAFAYADAHFPKNAQVLDIGCGTGFFAKEAAVHRKSWVIDGADIAEGMCAVSKPYYHYMMMADMQALPVKNASYGGIFSSLAVQWASDVEALWQEFSRVLKPGGVAVIASFAPGTLAELAASGEKAGLDQLVMPMQPAKNHASAMRTAGLEVLAVKEETILEHMPKVEDLIAHLRALGATNAHQQARRKLSAAEREAVIAAYNEKFRDEKGIRVSWQPIFLVARKG